MDTSEVLTYEMMVRVKDFSSTRTADFPPNSRGGQFFAEWTAIVTEFSRQAAVQKASDGAALVSGATKAALRASLREDSRVLISTTRVITADSPNLKKKFRVPRGGDQRFLAAARVFLQEVEPLAAEFPKHEIPAEALEKYKKDLDLFEMAISEQNHNRDSRVQATSRLESLQSQAFKILKKLDVIVRNKYRDDQANLAAWQSARHIERKTRSRNRSKTSQPKAEPPTGQTTSGVSATG